jgi:hypothetical protein
MNQNILHHLTRQCFPCNLQTRNILAGDHVHEQLAAKHITEIIQSYCDVLPESQNFGADGPSTFPPKTIGSSDNNRIAPVSIQQKCQHTSTTIGECNCYTTHMLEAFPSQRNPYSSCSQYGRPGGYIREKTFSSGSVLS